MAAKPTDFSKAKINQSLSDDDKIGFFRDMSRIRRFEQESLKYYNKGKMGGFLHLYIGQESAAVATVSLMGENDHCITTYRDHGHGIAVGMGMNECMAELYGKKTGCSKGKGGSMHFFAPDKNFWGGHGIVAGQTPLGAGIAYGLKFKGLTGSCMCFLGDGAVNQGAYHESLNLASLFELPVIYVIENNGYSMGTSLERSSSYQEYLAKRAESYDIAWDHIDGADIYELRAKAQTAIERAHNESKPTVLEIATYRYYGHSVSDANSKKYRTADEIEHYKKNHDPIRLWREKLIAEKVLDAKAAERIDNEAKAEAAASTKFAEESPYPDPEEILENVYWETDNNTEAGNTGVHFFNE